MCPTDEVSSLPSFTLFIIRCAHALLVVSVALSQRDRPAAPLPSQGLLFLHDDQEHIIPPY